MTVSESDSESRSMRPRRWWRHAPSYSLPASQVTGMPEEHSQCPRVPPPITLRLRARRGRAAAVTAVTSRRCWVACALRPPQSAGGSVGAESPRAPGTSSCHGNGPGLALP